MVFEKQVFLGLLLSPFLENLTEFSFSSADCDIFGHSEGCISPQ